jgi:prepilin-type N-terminal cleavage/methylation domain-containing protein
MMMTSTARSTRRAGFTLLEIMIALAVGGVALSSIYAVGAASTRHFRQQQRISTTQTALRAAVDQLKRDFQRAGFLATPNIQANGEACLPTPGSPLDDGSGSAGTGRLAGISTFAKHVTLPTSLDPATLNSWASVDTVTLMGNFATSGEYPGITISPDGLTVTLPMTWQSFRRDFTVWTGANAGQCDSAAFSNAFAVGRLARIHTLTERNFFSIIAASSCTGTGPATVTLTQRIPATCNGTAGWIAPVSTVRYQAADAVGDQVTRATATNRVTILRRTEVKPDDKGNPLTQGGTNAPIDDRSILDYLVRFNVDFMMSNGTALSFPAAPEADVRNSPQIVRGVMFDVAARTAEQEPEFSNLVSVLPSTAFKVLATPGAARVRQMHAEVLLPNLAYRNF